MQKKSRVHSNKFCQKQDLSLQCQTPNFWIFRKKKITVKEGPQKYVGPKNLRSKKNFGPKKFLGPKKSDLLFGADTMVLASKVPRSSILDIF